MRFGWILGFCAAITLSVPFGAADAPTLKVSIASEVEFVRLKPGEQEAVDLDVTVELKEFTCTSGTKVGVDLVPSSPRSDWFGAEPHPDGDTYATPKETKPATLNIVVDEEAPGNQEAVFRLQPVVHIPAPQSCNGVEPTIDAPEFSIRVVSASTQTSGKNEATSGAPNDGNGLPAPSLGSILLLGLGLSLFGRRRE